MKSLIKSIIVTVLIAAIVTTGISVSKTTAVAKTTKGGEFKNGGTVTIKNGDKLKLTVTDTNKEFTNSYINNYDIVSEYKWYSSNENILKVDTDFYDERESYAECVVLIGVGLGTATVTGKSKGVHHDITMTVTVTKSAEPVSLSNISLTLDTGKSKTITVKKANNVKIKKKTFTSSNKKVATVTNKGKVTAKKKGKAVIKVTVKYKQNKKTVTTSLKCNVIITNNPAETPARA